VISICRNACTPRQRITQTPHACTLVRVHENGERIGCGARKGVPTTDLLRSINHTRANGVACLRPKSGGWGGMKRDCAAPPKQWRARVCGITWWCYDAIQHPSSSSSWATVFLPEADVLLVTLLRRLWSPNISLHDASRTRPRGAGVTT
jgi:hypothetical protein